MELWQGCVVSFVGGIAFAVIVHRLVFGPLTVLLVPENDEEPQEKGDR